jgi:hypothetical protein
MTTTPQPDREPTLADVISRLDAITNDIDQVRQELKTEVSRWDERFFQLTRDNLSTAKTIIVTAGTVMILSPVLQALAPAIQAVVVRLLGGENQP